MEKLAQEGNTCGDVQSDYDYVGTEGIIISHLDGRKKLGSVTETTV